MTTPLRVLVVGVGSIGQRHVRCLQQTGRARVGICESLEGRRKEVAAEYRVTEAFATLDAALADPLQFDAAVVCTPADQHLSISLQLAQAGLHLLIEKPLGTSEEQLPQLEEQIRQRKLIAGVAYVYRYHPALAAMRTAIQEGRFGRPVQLVATCGQHFPTYRPAYRETYYTDRATGGGAVQDALTHVANAAEWLVGPIQRLTADLQHQLVPDVSVEDTVHVLARHGQVMGCYSLNQYQAPNEVTITVVCQRGTARFEYHQHRWRWLDDPRGEWQDESCSALERDELFRRQANGFLDAIQQGRETACSLQQAAQSLRVNLAILRAAETGTWQTVQAASEDAS